MFLFSIILACFAYCVNDGDNGVDDDDEGGDDDDVDVDHDVDEDV